MANKPDIGNKQFSKLLEPLHFKPNKNLIKRIDSKMFSLDMNSVYNYKPENLAFKEYERCLSLFERRNPGINIQNGFNRMAGVQKIIVKAEEPIKNELQDLCVLVIKSIYDIPDYVNLKAFINPRLTLDTEQNRNPESFISLSLEQKNKMIDQIRAREIHVGCIHGSSMHTWKSIYHLVSDELNKLNPSLMDLYDYYTSTVGISLWHINPDTFQDSIKNNCQITQGYSKVKSDKQKGFGGTIEANGINFPTLIHECNKGVMSYLFQAGIPKEYSEEELKYYYSIGDSYINEPWHYLLSPTLWVDLLSCARLENQDIPKLIARLARMSYQDLVELFRLIQTDKQAATKRIESWNIVTTY